MVKKNPHLGSSFESWLDEKGICQEVTRAATDFAIAKRFGKDRKPMTDHVSPLKKSSQN